MYTLKSIARRGSLLGSAAALVVAAVAPAVPAFADALNPLTERSLTLSSGSPGWSYLDASGNSTYSPPNSGANGRQTGNTFSFRVSSTSGSGAELKAFTFQYCTTSAGNCVGPGNIPFGGSGPSSFTRDTNNATQISNKKSDLEIVTATPSEVSTYGAKFNSSTGAPSSAANVPNKNNSEGNFIVLHKTPAASTWTQDTGWAMAATNVQTGTVATGTATGKNNYITLTKSAGVQLAAGDYVKIVFFGTDTNYITNPGSGAFFVKINTYNSDTTQDNSTLVDGGVTVANVMNRSIEIQTKVLETMDFSVGTVDPNTLATNNNADGSSAFAIATGRESHGVCDPVIPGMSTSTTTPNILQLGNADGEFSLETLHTYSTHSYWRLSSNSSAGATVYYSGVTLSNTVGDQIDAINGGTGIAAAPTPGSEQFGLALDNQVDEDSGTAGVQFPNGLVSYAKERVSGKLYQNGADNAVTGLDTASLTDDNVLSNGSWHAPRLYPLVADANYDGGTGVVNTDWNNGTDTVNTSFAFDTNSNLIPTPFVSENDQVVDCVTGKMRYIANIAATTPAGIYTTKINYIAAPQY